MSTEAPRYADLLRRLALNDVRTVDSLLGGSMNATDAPPLSDKNCVLVRVAALIATEAAATSYQWAVAGALAAGVTEQEVVAVLLTVAPVVGVARVASAATPLAAALGLDLDVLGEG
jgi:alkylhydroperoxidase/carboxymuconolactone decarboxylase family protein YurZ